MEHVVAGFSPRLHAPHKTKMRKNFAAVLFLAALPGVYARPAAAQVRPRIRAVTAYIEIDRTNYADKIAEAQKFLAAAKAVLNKAGFEGAGGRITTQPFPQYVKGMKDTEAVAFIGKLLEEARKGPSGLNIGPAMIHDNDDPAPAALLVK